MVDSQAGITRPPVSEIVPEGVYIAASGHLLVTGGSGPGKTTVALLKAQERCGTLKPGQEVLFLSFSLAAVKQILTRCKDILRPWFRERVVTEEANDGREAIYFRDRPATFPVDIPGLDDLGAYAWLRLMVRSGTLRWKLETPGSDARKRDGNCRRRHFRR